MNNTFLEVLSLFPHKPREPVIAPVLAPTGFRSSTKLTTYPHKLCTFSSSFSFGNDWEMDPKISEACKIDESFYSCRPITLFSAKEPIDDGL